MLTLSPGQNAHAARDGQGPVWSGWNLQKYHQGGGVRVVATPYPASRWLIVLYSAGRLYRGVLLV